MAKRKRTKGQTTIHKTLHIKLKTGVYDNKFGVDCFLCKCSDIKGLDIASIPKYYQDAMQAWNNFLGSCSTESKNDILDKNIFGVIIGF
jgi:hypothetical protein